MRTFLLIYGFLFSIGSTISQNLNFAEHVGVDQTSEVVCINSKSYFLTRTANNCDYTELYLNVTSSNGSTILKKLICSGGINNFGRILKTKDNKILFSWGMSYSTDAGPTKEFLVKLDTTGMILFQTQLNLFPDQFDPDPRVIDICQHQDSTYYLVANSDLLHFSSSGNYLSTISTPGIFGKRSICNLSNGNLLINGSTASLPYVNFIITTGGTILTQKNAQAPIAKMKQSAQYFIALNVNGIIEKYDSSLVFQGNTTNSLSLSSYTITDFALRNDSIFITGTYGSFKNAFYMILNSNLTLIYQTISGLQGICPSGISLPLNNSVHIVSTCYSASNIEYSFSSLHKLNLNGFFNSNSNIGVIGFSNINTHLIKSGLLCSPYLEMNATIKNFGVDTIKSFFLNSFADWGGTTYCLYLLHKSYQVNIPPGGTLSVTTGSFYAQWYLSDTSKFDSKNINICVFTTLPNHSNDANINDDGHCQNVLMTTTGIQKNEFIKTNMEIFPNPCKESFTIESGENMSGYAMYNSLGEKVKAEVFFAKKYTIQTGDLASGIYFIQIEGEKELLVKKLIKNE